MYTMILLYIYIHTNQNNNIDIPTYHTCNRYSYGISPGPAETSISPPPTFLPCVAPAWHRRRRAECPADLAKRRTCEAAMAG